MVAWRARGGRLSLSSCVHASIGKWAYGRVMPKDRQSITFPSRKPTPASKQATHESVAADLAAFESAGGQIEVLGATSKLKHIGLAATAAEAPAKDSE